MRTNTASAPAARQIRAGISAKGNFVIHSADFNSLFADFESVGIKLHPSAHEILNRCGTRWVFPVYSDKRPGEYHVAEVAFVDGIVRCEIGEPQLVAKKVEAVKVETHLPVGTKVDVLKADGTLVRDYVTKKVIAVDPAKDTNVFAGHYFSRKVEGLTVTYYKADVR